MTTAATHHAQRNPTEATLFLAFELSGHWFSVMGTVLPFEIITYAI
jgi:hypothetical protein